MFTYTDYPNHFLKVAGASKTVRSMVEQTSVYDSESARPDEDSELVHQILSGDEDAFEAQRGRAAGQ